MENTCKLHMAMDLSDRKLNPVELGFAEECDDPEEFSSGNFPSKIGGKPVWLDPAFLPPPNKLSCLECQKPCVLLLQVYAPHTDDPETYHRTLFVFMCTNSQCFKQGSSNPFKVFRCQLSKQNPYYADVSIESDSEPNSLEALHDSSKLLTDVPLSLPSLCCVCGSPGPSRCGQCLSVNYCSSYHQLIHWKNGHKVDCKEIASGDTEGHSPLFIVLLMRIYAQSILLAQEHLYSIIKTFCMNCIDLHLEHFYMYIWASCKCMNVHGLFCFVVYNYCYSLLFAYNR